MVRHVDRTAGATHEVFRISDEEERSFESDSDEEEMYQRPRWAASARRPRPAVPSLASRLTQGKGLGSRIAYSLFIKGWMSVVLVVSLLLLGLVFGLRK